MSRNFIDVLREQSKIVIPGAPVIMVPIPGPKPQSANAENSEPVETPEESAKNKNNP